MWMGGQGVVFPCPLISQDICSLENCLENIWEISKASLVLLSLNTANVSYVNPTILYCNPFKGVVLKMYSEQLIVVYNLMVYYSSSTFYKLYVSHMLFSTWIAG